jgi:hypothetical protein
LLVIFTDGFLPSVWRIEAGYGVATHGCGRFLLLLWLLSAIHHAKLKIGLPGELIYINLLLNTIQVDILGVVFGRGQIPLGTIRHKKFLLHKGRKIRRVELRIVQGITPEGALLVVRRRAPMQVCCRVHEAREVHLFIVVQDCDVLLLRLLIGRHPRHLWQGIVVLSDDHLDWLVKGVMPLTLSVVMLPLGVLPGTLV